MSAHSFTDYVSKKLNNKLYDAMEEYFKNVNSSCFSFPLKKIKDIGEVEIQDYNVLRVGVYNKESTNIGFDVIYDLELEIYEVDRYSYPDGEYYHQWYLMKCEGDLLSGLNNMVVKKIEPYYSKDRNPKPMSDSLVPIISLNDMETYANEILKKYCPEALDKPMFVDPMKIVEKMGLDLQVTQITKDSSIFGQIYFVDKEADIYDRKADKPDKINVREGTILVDEDVVFQNNLGSLNNTIIHECVHWELHKKAFQLERLYNEEATQIKCKVDGDIDGMSTEAMGWMEWQANSLAPRIQMPLAQFKLKTSELLRKYENQYNNFHICDVLPYVIDELADFYKVSRMSVKVRLVDAGYHEANGVLVYIDEHYIKPFSYKKGAIESNQTYCVSAMDAAVLSRFDLDLYNHIHDGGYVYIDSHFVLNDPKYVTRDEKGYIVMTDYARYHVDECCIAFELKIKNKISSYYAKICFLNNGKDSLIEFEPKFKKGINNKSKAVEELMQDDRKLCMSLPNDFGAALKKCIEWSGRTQKDICAEVGISEDTLSRIINSTEGHRPERNTIILLIFAIHIPNNSNHLLFSLSPSPLQLKYDSDAWIDYALTYLYPYSIEQVREFLADKKVYI